jgi:hypothetical protein
MGRVGFSCVDLLYLGLFLRLTILVHHAGFAKVFLAGWVPRRMCSSPVGSSSKLFLAGWFLVVSFRGVNELNLLIIDFDLFPP